MSVFTFKSLIGYLVTLVTAETPDLTLWFTLETEALLMFETEFLVISFELIFPVPVNIPGDLDLLADSIRSLL